MAPPRSIRPEDESVPLEPPRLPAFCPKAAADIDIPPDVGDKRNGVRAESMTEGFRELNEMPVPPPPMR